MTGLCESVNLKTGQAFWWIFDNNFKTPFEFTRDDVVPGSRGLRRGSAGPYLLRLRVRIPQGDGSLVSVVCCRGQVSATGRSFTHRSPIDCGVSEFDIEISKRRRRRPTRTVEQ